LEVLVVAALVVADLEVLVAAQAAAVEQAEDGE
jgi:hypothetical protein